MDRLVTVRDIRERYGCSQPTARKYIRQMFHFEKPLTAPLWAVTDWEQSRSKVPTVTSGQTTTRRTGHVVVPRKRG